MAKLEEETKNPALGTLTQVEMQELQQFSDQIKHLEGQVGRIDTE